MTWFDTNYLYKKKLTIDHTKVSGSADLSSFPVLISNTDADLKTVGNGGKVQNTSGFDIIFTDSTETTKLDHEIEHYVASTGEVEMWVRIPTLSHTADTVIYLYFDNSTISTSQENATGTWDTNFKAVWHLKESAGTSNSVKDSTSNANHLTPFSNVGTNTIGDISTPSGQIDGAQSFDGSGRVLDIANPASLDIGATNILTISAWVKRTATTTTGIIVEHGSVGVGGYVLAIGVSPATTNQVKMTKYGIVDIVGGSFPADTSFHHLVESGDASGTYAYIDGSLNFTSADHSNWNANTTFLYIGAGAGGASFWNGTIDEVRISNVTRASGWIGTEYSNQNSPATFYSVGALTGQALSLVTQAQAKFSVRANLQTQTRSKFLVRLALKTQAEARFLVRLALRTQAEAKFSVRSIQQTQARAKFLTRAKLGTTARSKFVTRLALSSPAWAKFLVNQVIAPPTHFISATWVTRDMQATWKTRDGKVTWKTRQ